MLDSVLFCFWGITCSLLTDFGRLGGPEKGRLVQLNAGSSAIWADSAGWKVVTVLAEWKMAPVTVLVEVEMVKMLVVCRSTGIVVHLGSHQRGSTIQKCYVDFLLS